MSNSYKEECKVVSINVLCIVGIAVCIGMIVTGSVFSNTCPGHPMMSVHLIVQGSITVLLPLLYLVYYRCWKVVKERYFLTLYITLALGCIGWLAAGIYFLATATCYWMSLYIISLTFIGTLVLIFFISIIALCRYSCSRFNSSGNTGTLAQGMHSKSSATVIYSISK